MEYSEDEFLMLSGLQHFIFCRRQWALIHIENQWEENYRTVDGSLMHEAAHDKGFSESRGDRLITRGMAVFSAVLGVSGECDVLEFLRHENGITLPNKEGTWMPYPVEYKRGSFNSESGDTLQLCCQAMCLEEMLCCKIPEGALYFGETRRRMPVEFSAELREKVTVSLAEMHELYNRGYTPKVKQKKSCRSCSLVEICLPALNKTGTAKEYLQANIEEG